MPYLHYEKRCHQAKIHETIMNVTPRAMWKQELRQRNGHTKQDGSTSSSIDSDDDHMSIHGTNGESLELAASLTPEANQRFSQWTQPTLDEDEEKSAKDEEKSAFLKAEEKLIEGYLYGQEKMHVSITVITCPLASSHNKAG